MVWLQSSDGKYNTCAPCTDMNKGSTCNSAPCQKEAKPWQFHYTKNTRTTYGASFDTKDQCLLQICRICNEKRFDLWGNYLGLNSFHGQCGKIEFLQSTRVLDEGNGVGDVYDATVEQCKKACRDSPKCKSFTRNGKGHRQTCHLKDKCVAPGAPIKTGDHMDTFYKTACVA